MEQTYLQDLEYLLTANEKLFLELQTQQTLSTITMNKIIETFNKVDIKNVPAKYEDVEESLAAKTFPILSADSTLRYRALRSGETEVAVAQFGSWSHTAHTCIQRARRACGCTITYRVTG